MPDSNAIKAGEAYVELTTKNNVGAGVAGAKRDIASLTDSTKAAAAAQLTDAGKVRVAQEEASGRLAKYAEKFLKVAAVIGIVKTAYGQMQEKANEVLDQQIERMGKLGDAGRELFEKRKGLADWRLVLGSPGDQAAATKRAADEAQKDMLAKERRLNEARKAIDEFKEGNKMVSFTGGVRLIEKTDNPFGGAEFTTAEKKRREAVLQEAEKDFAQAQKGVEGYKKALRELGDPNENKELVTGLDAVTKGLKEQMLTLGMAPEFAAVAKKALDGATAAQLAGPEKVARAAVWDRLQKDMTETTRQWDIQVKSIDHAAEQVEAYRKQMDAVKDLGPGAAAEVEKKFAGLRDNATATATARLKKEAELAKRDIDDELDDKRRLAANALTGASSKGGFGAMLGAGSFDYGGGGPWQGIGVTLKDLLEVERRKEQVDIDTNRKIDRLADVAQ